MATIRRYQESDAERVGWLIADTFRKFNLTFASHEEQALLLGPLQHARSDAEHHQEAIARVITASMVFVAEKDSEIIGVLRGRTNRLQSLFVQGIHHRQGIGSRLVSRFEQECIKQGASQIKVAATLHAVPFYEKLGYKKTTGVRAGRSFEGTGLPWQPMKKILSLSRGESTHDISGR